MMIMITVFVVVVDDNVVFGENEKQESKIYIFFLDKILVKRRKKKKKIIYTLIVQINLNVYLYRCLLFRKNVWLTDIFIYFAIRLSVQEKLMFRLSFSIT